MKRLITICAVVGMMLSLTSVSWATLNGGPAVNHPPGDDPEWWNNECIYYAYAWWEDDIYPGGDEVSPPDDATHWATNFLESNEDFYAFAYDYQGEGSGVYIYMQNRYERELKKEIYIYLRGTTVSTSGYVQNSLYTAEGTFEGFSGQYIGDGQWWSMVTGEIIPQPSYQYLYVSVPGLTSVTDIWVGENCIPEPATISLLGLGVLSLIRRKRSV
jgi:hypothetical protein